MNKKLTVGEIWDDKWESLDISKFRNDAFESDKWTIFHKSIIDKYLNKIGKNGVFLEAGCGMGQWCFYVAEKYGLKSFGVDVAEKTIQKLNYYCGKLNNNLINFIADDLNDSKMESQFCDMFVSLGVIEHFQDPKPMLKNLHRLLKSKGIGIITVPNVYSMHSITRPILKILNRWNIGYERSFSPRELKNLSLSLGFKIIECGILPSGEIFGSFINNLPFVGWFFRKLGLFIERKQNTFGFISFVVVQK